MYLLSGLFGAILGAAIARNRRVKALDMAQYAAGYGLLFALFGLIITIIFDLTVILRVVSALFRNAQKNRHSSFIARIHQFSRCGANRHGDL